MVADTLVVQGNYRVGRCIKIYKTPIIYGVTRLIAAIGDLSLAQEFVRYIIDSTNILGDCEKPVFSADSVFEALVVASSAPKELFFYDTTLFPHKIEADFHAIGSGMGVALGALEAGKTAREALEIVCKYDIYSQTPIIEETFD